MTIVLEASVFCLARKGIEASTFLIHLSLGIDSAICSLNNLHRSVSIDVVPSVELSTLEPKALVLDGSLPRHPILILLDDQST